MLHHGGLLAYEFDLNKPILKSHINTFIEARTQVLAHMVSELQVEKEWKHLVESFHEKAIVEDAEEEEEEPREKVVVARVKGRRNRVSKISKVPDKLREARDKEREAHRAELVKKAEEAKMAEIEARLSLAELVGKLLALKRLPDKGNAKENRAQLLELLKAESPQRVGSPYLSVCERAVERCLFLLELNSPVSSQHNAPAADNESIETEHNEEEELKPLGMSRCLSHQTGEKNIDKGKVEMFREWIESWKRWKKVRARSEEDSHEDNLVSNVVFFLNYQVLSLADLRRAIRKHNLRAANRVICMAFNNQLLKVVSCTFLETIVLAAIRSNAAYLQEPVTCAHSHSKRLLEATLRDKLELTSGICLARTKKLSVLTFQNLAESK
jgi:hypothetical protein